MRRPLLTLIVAVMAAAVPRAQVPALDTVLARAAADVAACQKRLQGIVAEELYIQNYTNTGRSRGRQRL